MEQLRERASIMFQGGHIAFFVYVDDKFGNKELSKEDSKVYVAQHLDDFEFITNDVIWEDEFEDWWSSKSEEERQKFFLSFGVQVENADDLKGKFEQILPNNISRQYLTPEQFGQKKDTILAQLDASHQLMMLVDYKLEDYGRNGEDILEQIAKTSFVNCAIFSGTFHIDNELEQWNSSQDKANIYKLSKERLSSDNEDEILEGLRSVLWLKQISQLKEQTKEILSKASDLVGQQLDNIDPTTFHKVVLDRSEKEGCWEFDTLWRIVYAYLGISVKNNLINGGFSVFQQFTSNLRQIRNDATAYKANADIIKTIEEEESYESADFINKTFSQISNGDIFKVGQSTKEFILLCQPCNLEIRTGGNRNNKFDQFYLVPIRILNDGEKKGPFDVELKKTKDGLNKVVELSKYHRVSLSLLDLVSFNSDGKAIINLKQTIENHPKRTIIQRNMMKRYASIWKTVKEYKDKYDKIQASNFSKDEKIYLCKEFCRPFEMGDNVVAKHPNKVQGKADVLDFQIERISRYKDPYAKDLLSLFMDYLSRPAYPMGLNPID